MKSHFLFAPLLLAFASSANAEQAVQELEYRSAFEGYQAYSDSEIQNWPKANQLVDEIGGWRVYAREPYEDKEKDKPAVSREATQPNAHKHGGAQ
jgi:opacity protein-like surface antigen